MLLDGVVMTFIALSIKVKLCQHVFAKLELYHKMKKPEGKVIYDDALFFTL